MKTITFIIPVHNRLSCTQECLKILESHQESKFFTENIIKVIVVNDGSSDGTEEWIKMTYPEVIVINGDGNLWYSGAVNEGIKYATSELDPEFFLVWENDAVPGDDYFDRLQEIITAWDGKIVICSKLYYRAKPDIILAMGGSFNPRNGKKFLNRMQERDKAALEIDLMVDWFSGHGFLIHKNIVSEVGLLDNLNFPQYHSDVDYGLRIVRAGYKNIVFHKLKLYHDTATTGINHKKNKSLYEFLESLYSIRSNYNIKRNIRFYQKHGTSIYAYSSLLKKYIIYFGSFIKWSFLGMFGIHKKDDGLY